MHIARVVKYLDRHPWASLAAGVGLTAFSILRIRGDAKARREAKAARRVGRRRLKSDRHEEKRLQRVGPTD